MRSRVFAACTDFLFPGTDAYTPGRLGRTMIRTSFSFLMLCICLFVASKLVHQSTAAEKARTTKHVYVAPTGSPYIAAFDLQPTSKSSQESLSLTGNTKSSSATYTPVAEIRHPKEDTKSYQTTDSQASDSEATDLPTTGLPTTGTTESTDSFASELFGNTETVETKTATTESNEAVSESTDVVPEETKVVPESKSTTESTENSDAKRESAKAAEEFSAQQIQLRERIRDVLAYYFNRQENVAEHSPWGIMHVLIAYGVDTEVIGNNRKMNAIGWLCWNGACRGQQLFYLQGKRIHTPIGPGVQGHAGQFLAMLAQSRVKSNYPMRIEGKDYSVTDLIEHEKFTCEAGTELTFKLIGLSHYLDTETQWKAETGEKWNIARLVREELAQPIVGAACGGTHRMTGFTYAVRKREKEGKPIDGQFLRAQKFLNDYIDYAYYLQNEDGSFSTDFFRGRNGYGDINRRLETSGHILEWFVASLSNEQLRDPRVVKSVSYLTSLLMDNREHEWEIGPRGHALHALAIYGERVFKDKPGQRDAVLARGRKVENGRTTR
jgi:hypothetical protein